LKSGVNSLKLDIELIRKLMLEIESNDDDFKYEPIQALGYDESQIDYHLQQLIEAKLVIGEVHHFLGTRTPSIIIEKLSWEGHKFLETARNEPVWKEAMNTVKEKGGSVGIGILTQVLTSVAKQHFGLV
jgi:hypothetical protein